MVHLQGPVSSPGAPGRCCSPPVVLRVPGHGHRPAHSSENIDPVVGGASWSGACGVFFEWSPHVRPPSRRHVSFADGVTMLGAAELPVCSPKAEFLPLILPVVVEEISDAPESKSPPVILPVVVEDSSVAPVKELIGLVHLPWVPVCRLHRDSHRSRGRSTTGEWTWTNCALELVWFAVVIAD